MAVVLHLSSSPFSPIIETGNNAYMMPTPARQMTPTLDQFCRTAAMRVRLPKGKFLPAQMQSVIGGICNLYLSRMIQQGPLPEWIVETHNAVASDAVPLSAILAQIHYSSGVRMADAPAVLNAFAETLRNEFGDQARSVSVMLPGLGNFSAIDADHAHYRLTIRDDTAVAPASLNG